MSWEPDISLPIDEYRIEDLDLITATATEESRFNLIPYLQRLELVESIDSSFVQGVLRFSVLKGELKSRGVDFTMQDFIVITTSSIESLQNDGVSAKLSEPRKIGGVFYITDLIKKEISDTKVDSYTLHFSSTEVLNEYTRKVSKSYKKQTRSDIIKRITKDFLIKDTIQESKLGIFEQTKDQFQCVIPKWSPMTSIDWLSQGCISTENEDSKCFSFFQTFDDDGDRKINLRSLRTMFRSKPSVGKDGNFLTGYALLPYDSHLDELEKRTLARRTPLRCVMKNVSGLDKIFNGMYSSKLLSHDITRKTFTEHQFEFDNTHVANEKVNRGLMVEDNKVDKDFDKNFLKTGDSYIKMDHDHKNLFRKFETNLGVNKTENWFQEYLNQKNVKNFITLEITVYGDTSRNVGETVMFTSAGIYEKDDENLAVELDQEGIDLAGKYLITKIIHTFSTDDEDGSLGGKNTTKMVLVKDGWQI
tara:strand:- start:7684 stop:9108 length:1425 start_codon:yes stop_codon:yes gene_type:complete